MYRCSFCRSLDWSDVRRWANLVYRFLTLPVRELTNLSSWANNCIATNTTNGVDQKTAPSSNRQRIRRRAELLNPAAGSPSQLDLPSLFLPTLPPSDGSTGIMKTFILPGNNTGVVCNPDALEFLI